MVGSIFLGIVAGILIFIGRLKDKDGKTLHPYVELIGWSICGIVAIVVVVASLLNY